MQINTKRATIQKHYRDLDVCLRAGGDASVTLQDGDVLGFSVDASTLAGDVAILYANGERVRIAEAAIAVISLRDRTVEIEVEEK